jgi:hypothetical protein
VEVVAICADAGEDEDEAEGAEEVLEELQEITFARKRSHTNACPGDHASGTQLGRNSSPKSRGLIRKQHEIPKRRRRYKLLSWLV